MTIVGRVLEIWRYPVTSMSCDADVAAWLSALTGRRVTLWQQLPPGRAEHYRPPDVTPLHLLTAASLATLAEGAPGSAFEISVRRCNLISQAVDALPKDPAVLRAANQNLGVYASVWQGGSGGGQGRVGVAPHTEHRWTSGDGARSAPPRRHSQAAFA